MRMVVTVAIIAAWLVGVERPDTARADEKPAPGKGYELRVVSFGNSYHGIRFKPATGESWIMLNGRWEKADEAAAPPAGDYEITIIPAGVLLAVRIDRATGTTWLLNKKEVERREGTGTEADAPAAKPPGPGCALRHVVLDDQLHVVRFHSNTGATWHLKGDTFEPLAEFDKVPAGDFDITLITGKKDWMGFRLDRKTGTTWILQAHLWQTVTEPE